MGSEYSAYHSTDIYANAGWQMEWYVQTESEGLHCSCSWQSLGGCCRIYGECSFDDSIYGTCSIGAGSMAGRYECCDCFLFRVHVSDAGKKSGWDDVLLHFPWSENRRRHRNCIGGVALRIQRLCWHKGSAATVGPQYDAIYVSVAPFYL